MRVWGGGEGGHFLPGVTSLSLSLSLSAARDLAVIRASWSPALRSLHLLQRMQQVLRCEVSSAAKVSMHLTPPPTNLDG